MKAADEKTPIAGVIGWPVKHSLSPAIHNRWMEQYRIEGAYVPLPVQPEKLQNVISALPDRGYVGVNLTVPHKELVLPMLDEVDDLAASIGAVNTIVVKDGKLLGKNTDAYGFWKNVESEAPALRKEQAFVIGAGGAARAVVTALANAGYQKIRVMNRTKEKALSFTTLSNKVEVVEWSEAPDGLSETDLLVNTTSLGMEGQPELVLSIDALPSHAVVTDIVYSPLHTPLLLKAKARNLHTVDGLGMLLYQAQMAFFHWFGVMPDCDHTLREYVLNTLEQA